VEGLPVHASHVAAAKARVPAGEGRKRLWKARRLPFVLFTYWGPSLRWDDGPDL